jgi:hypothetical protein
MAIAKGNKYRTKKATAKRSDVTKAVTQPRTKGVKILSSEDSKNVGRPGFGGMIPGPVDGKDSVKRVRQIDPARGITQPGADIITTSPVDLVGPVNPKVVGGVSNTKSVGAGRRVVPPLPKSQPVKR